MRIEHALGLVPWSRRYNRAPRRCFRRKPASPVRRAPRPAGSRNNGAPCPWQLAGRHFVGVAQHHHAAQNIVHAGGDGRDDGQEAGIDENQAVFGVADDIGDVVVRQARIDGVADRAHAGNGVIKLEMAVAVHGQRGDAVAGFHAEIAQDAGAGAAPSVPAPRKWCARCRRLRGGRSLRRRHDGAPHGRSATKSAFRAVASGQAWRSPLAFFPRVSATPGRSASGGQVCGSGGVTSGGRETARRIGARDEGDGAVFGDGQTRLDIGAQSLAAGNRHGGDEGAGGRRIVEKSAPIGLEVRKRDLDFDRPRFHSRQAGAARTEPARRRAWCSRVRGWAPLSPRWRAGPP